MKVMHIMNKTIIRKTVSIILTASIGASLASCRTTPTTTNTRDYQTTVTTTTSETTEIPTTETEPPTPTPLFTKTYTYTLFEDNDVPLTLSMNIDIDEYLKSTDDGEVFELFRLASDLGWLEMGEYTYEDYQAAMAEDPDQKKIGHSNWFTYDYGDHCAVFSIALWIDDIEEYGEPQLSLATFEYLRKDLTLPFFDDYLDNPAHGKVILNYRRHFSLAEYHVEGQHCRCSRSDAIILAYSLWCITNSPNDNSSIQDPFEPYRDYDYDIIIP